MKRLTTIELKHDNETTRRLAISLSKRSYLSRRITLKTQPNDFPRFLYKYLRPDIPNEWLRDLLIHSRLYLSSPTDFNDPFDMKGHVVDEHNVRKRRAHINELIKQRAPHLKWKERNAIVNCNMRDPGLFEKLKGSLLEVIKRHGIFCFSTDPRSIVMWSHYGHHHKGIVLQFEYARDVINFQYVLPIDYRKDYPKIEYYGDPRTYQEFILGKYDDWSYENEWRLVRHECAHTYHPFDPTALVGVILGCRIEQKEEDRVKMIIVERQKLGLGRVRLYKARLHESRYKLVVSGLR